MKSSLPNYKDYPFPVRTFLAYVILTAVGIVGMDMLAVYIIVEGVTTIPDIIVGSIIMLVAFVVLWAVFSYLFFKLSGKKVYRGIGLYRFGTIVSILCPIVFVIMIIIVNATQTPYNFFNLATLFLECAFPPIMYLTLRHFTKRCDQCGLINTLKYHTSSTESLGAQHKYHEEGGYYETQKTKGRITEKYSAVPQSTEVEFTTTHYVPKTTVYDGLYKKTKTTKIFKCCVCGNGVRDISTNETKIGG